MVTAEILSFNIDLCISTLSYNNVLEKKNACRQLRGFFLYFVPAYSIE
jgi:hypothetical protein